MSELAPEGYPTTFCQNDVRLNIAGNRLRQVGKSPNFVSDATVALLVEAQQVLDSCDTSLYDDPSESWRHNWQKGAVSFYLFCQTEKKEHIDAAIQSLTEAAAPSQNAEILSLLSQCERLAGNDRAGDDNLALAMSADPHVFVADSTDRKAVR